MFRFYLKNIVLAFVLSKTKDIVSLFKKKSTAINKINTIQKRQPSDIFLFVRFAIDDIIRYFIAYMQVAENKIVHLKELGCFLLTFR